MHRSRKIFLVALTIILVLTCAYAEARRRSPNAPRAERRPKVVAASLERKIHEAINRERKKHGLGPLIWDDRLARVARRHSADMAKRSYFSHVSPEGRDFAVRYRREGYACSVRKKNTVYTGAENIFQNNLYDSVTTVNGRRYYDWNSADEISETTVAGWMQSPGHRKNILTPHWGKEGIGVNITRDGKVYITQNFC